MHITVRSLLTASYSSICAFCLSLSSHLRFGFASSTSFRISLARVSTFFRAITPISISIALKSSVFISDDYTSHRHTTPTSDSSVRRPSFRRLRYTMSSSGKSLLLISS